MANLLHRSPRIRPHGLRPLLVACLALLLIYAPGSTVGAPTTGASAPDFALRSLAGENFRLSEHLGDVVILNFWATWCGSCRQEMPLLDEIYLKYRRAGLVVFSVNIDEDAEPAAEMAKTLGVSYPVLLDERKDVARAFAIGNLPVTVLIDRAGVVRYVSDGYKPGYEKRYTEQLRELLNE